MHTRRHHYWGNSKAGTCVRFIVRVHVGPSSPLMTEFMFLCLGKCENRKGAFQRQMRGLLLLLPGPKASASEERGNENTYLMHVRSALHIIAVATILLPVDRLLCVLVPVRVLLVPDHGQQRVLR